MFSARNISRSTLEEFSRSRIHSQYLGDHQAICRVLGENLIFVDTRDYTLAPHLIMDGYWESWITLCMMQTLKTGMTAVDVGANLGYYSVLMGNSVGASGKVHVFEPNTYLSQLIRKSLSVGGLLPRTTLHERAVYSKTGLEVLFYIPDGHPMNAQIVDERGSMGGETISVITTRLDDVIAGKVDFVKIDAEGAEREVWRGMERIISDNSDLQIFLEFNPQRLQHYDPEEFLHTIQADGFQLAVVDTAGGSSPTTGDALLSEGAEVILHLRRLK